jgi:hypothetical protein
LSFPLVGNPSLVPLFGKGARGDFKRIDCLEKSPSYPPLPKGDKRKIPAGMA